MDQVDKLRRNIDFRKGQLKKSLMIENFGQKEMRFLRDKFTVYAGEDYHERQIILDLLNDFDNWCMNYTKEVGQ